MVVIEIIGSEGKTPRFERPVQDVVRIGRALDNDVIIDDPYVDAHHLVLDVTDPEHWFARDVGSANGTFKGRKPIDTASIVSGDELLVGKTRVRMFRRDHAVAPPRSLRDLEHLLLGFGGVGVMVGLMLVTAAVPMIGLYLASAGTDLRPDIYMRAGSSILITSLVAAAFWALIARVLRGESRFRVLFSITMLMAVISDLARPLVGMLFYNFPGSGGDEVMGLLLSALMMGLYIYLVLLLSTRLRSRMSQAISVILATAAIGTYALTEYSIKDEFRPYPEYDGAVYSPAVLVRQGKTPTEFELGLPDVFEQADQLASESADKAD